MVVKLEAPPYGDGSLPIPRRVLIELGWEEGDEIQIDVSMVHPDTLIVSRVEIYNA